MITVPLVRMIATIGTSDTWDNVILGLIAEGEGTSKNRQKKEKKKDEVELSRQRQPYTYLWYTKSNLVTRKCLCVRSMP